MSALRELEFDKLYQVVDELRSTPFRFSIMSRRQRLDNVQSANRVMTRFLEKTVGEAKEDKFSFLLYHLKLIHPRGSHISEILKDFKPLKDFSTLTQSERLTNGRGSYKSFDLALQKFSGSDSPHVQRNFLNNRYQSIHQLRDDYKPLVEQPSWRSIKNSTLLKL